MKFILRTYNSELQFLLTIQEPLGRFMQYPLCLAEKRFALHVQKKDPATYKLTYYPDLKQTPKQLWMVRTKFQLT